jgi:predicted nucleic acid-binding Zn ribbon protein
MTKFDKEINEVTHCMYCGNKLKKEEGKPIKFCPEGCVEILFVPNEIDENSKTDEEIKKKVNIFMDIEKIPNRRFPSETQCRGDMIS